MRYDVDWDYVTSTYDEARARGTCAVTGQPFGVDGQGGPFCPSPDRLDCNEGYVRGHSVEGAQGNLVWVLACINRARSNYRIEDLAAAGVFTDQVVIAYMRLFDAYEAAKSGAQP